MGKENQLANGTPTIQRLSVTHLDIARWLVANPKASLGECAEHFGYTRGWISIITHSDMFKAHMAELQAEADTLVLNDIPAKLRGTASMALEGLADQVEKANADGSVMHRQFLLDTSEKLLKSLGYGQKPQQTGNGVTINNPTGPVLVASADDLARARELMAQRQSTVPSVASPATELPTPTPTLTVEAQDITHAPPPSAA